MISQKTNMPSLARHQEALERRADVESDCPVVSVLIPAYNCAAYIGSAIESALGQRDVPLEVIVVDDGSTDTTAEIARSYAERAPVRVFINETNRGVSYSRNRAIRESHGEWLAQLDADDWFAPDRLATLLTVARQSRADLVSDDVYLVRDTTQLAFSTRFIDNDVLFQSTKWITPLDLVKFDLGAVKPLMRREFLVRNALFYPEDVRYGEDFLLLLKALLTGGRMLLVPTPMYHLRRGNTGSLTTHTTQLYAQVLATTQQLLDDPFVQADQPLAISLIRRQNHVVQFAALTEVVRLAKGGRVGRALLHLIMRPALLPVAVKRGGMVIGVRMRRLRHRNMLTGASRPPLANMPTGTWSLSRKTS